MAKNDTDQEEKKLTPAQEIVLELENSHVFTPEQRHVLVKVVQAVAPEAGHGGYTFTGERLWAADADKAHRIERDPETGNLTEYNGRKG